MPEYEVQVDRYVGNREPYDKCGLDDFLRIVESSGHNCRPRRRHRHWFTVYKNGQFLHDVCFCGLNWGDPNVLGD